jgi:hypothetical protein
MRRPAVALVAAVVALTLLGPASAHGEARSAAAPATPVKGVAVTLGFANRVSDAKAMAIAGHLFPMLRKTLHANAVSLNFPLWQSSSTSNDPRRVAMTPSPQRMVALTLFARGCGLQVQWRPYLYEGNLVGRSHNRIQPTSPHRWFSSYWAFLKPYLQAAQTAGVSSFSIGSELASMLPYLSNWTVLVQQAKQLFSGEIVYSQQHQPQRSIPLTARGYDAYQPITLAPGVNVSVAAFTKGFLHNLRLPEMQSTPEDLTLEEVGLTATAHAYLRPGNYTFGPNVRIMRQVQADWFAGACNAFWTLHLRGIYFFSIAFDRYVPSENNSTSISAWLGTATQDVIARCFTRTAAARTAAPAAAPRAAKAASWGATSGIETPAGHPLALSCPSSAFCAAGDDAGDVVLDHAGDWSAPVPLGDGAVVGVACGSPTSCVAVTANGGASSYGGSTWSPPRRIDGAPLVAVACPPGSADCTATDAAGRVLVDRSGAWSTPLTVATSPLTAIACPSSSACLAIDASGLAYRETASRWIASRLGSSTLTSVACPAVGRCIVGDDVGTIYVTSGGPWRAFRHAVTPSVSALACQGVASCVALARGSSIAVDPDVAVARPTVVFPGDGTAAVACAPSSTCTAVSQDGLVATRSLTQWGTPSRMEPRPGLLTAVSCGSASFCVVGDDLGRASTWDGATWTALAPTGLDGISALGCTGSTCAAVSNSGRAALYATGQWQPARFVDALGALTAVSCASTTYCLAADASNHTLAFNGTTWSAPTTRGVHETRLRGYVAVACTASSTCLSVDTGGLALVTTKSTHLLTRADTEYVPLTSVSCASPTSCVTVDEQGRAAVYSATTRPWGRPNAVDPYRLTSVSCSPDGTCVAVDDDGGAVAYVAGRWERRSASGLASGFVAVACPTAALCLAASAQAAAVLHP